MQHGEDCGASAAAAAAGTSPSPPLTPGAIAAPPPAAPPPPPASGSTERNTTTATTTTTTTTTATTTTGGARGGPKRRFAVGIGYVGDRYFGLQHNHDPLHPTIEAELLAAFHRVGLISDDNMSGNTLQKCSWQRASRTDKGVHALRNLLSLKLQTIPGDDERHTLAVTRVNEALPREVRVLFMKQVTRSFNAKLFCSGRKYEYWLPTFALMRRDVFNAVFTHEVAPEDPDPQEISKQQQQQQQQEEEEEGVSGGGGDDSDDGGGGAGLSAPPSAIIRADPGTRCPNPDDARFCFTTADPELLREVAAFRIDGETLRIARALFAAYEGTHAFHNFTPRGRAADAATVRFLRSVTVGEPFVRGFSAEEDLAEGSAGDKGGLAAAAGETYELEWVSVELVGQSFMLNQIRKMIGCVCAAITMGLAPDADAGVAFMRSCLSPQVQRGIPMAPANGLFLVDLFFDRYNHRLDRLRAKPEPEALRKDAIDFEVALAGSVDAECVRRRVLRCIVRRETTEHITTRWMRGMRYIVKLAWGISREIPAAAAAAALLPPTEVDERCGTSHQARVPASGCGDSGTTDELSLADDLQRKSSRAE